MEVPVHLQQILGVDKKNPWFTICRDSQEPGRLLVFFGSALMETVNENRDSPEFKLLVARLYNAGLKVESLKKVFKIPRTTMQRWGDALKSGDPERLLRTLSGPNQPRKLTKEILSFTEMRFKDVYPENRYNYSSEIRKEIKDVFNVDISGESLRLYFKKWKEKYGTQPSAPQGKEKSEQGACANQAEAKPTGSLPKGKDVGEVETTAANAPSESPCVEVEGEQASGKGAEISLKNQHAVAPNPKRALPFFKSSGEYLFCHHVGVLLFSGFFAKINHLLGDQAGMVKQWLATILLGAINIEQTKTLDFDALEAFLGKVSRNLGAQRNQLENMASKKQSNSILKLNASMVQAALCSDFYYDPHTKHYTGLKKILKGWCANIRFADKLMNIDFLHTSSGHPVYMAHDDNFHDLRVRFFAVTTSFRELLGLPKEKAMTFILDRGIYGLEVFQKVMKSLARNYFITWEKGYKGDLWDESKVSGNFDAFKPRNSSYDLRRYCFEFIDGVWKRDNKIRQIIVRATNPRGRTIEVSILTNDLNRQAKEVVMLMFLRWIQENDFKYLDIHFGINEITSYGAIHYRELENIVEDKQVKSGAFKALEVKKAKLKKRLGALLLQEHRGLKPNAKRDERIKELTLELKEMEKQMGNAEKEQSRLQAAVKGNFLKLDMLQKSVMDSIKILARNMFYIMLEPFKKMYDNYRDDHVIFRNLTRAHGCIRLGEHFVDVTLFPTAHYQPKIRRIMETIFKKNNEESLPLPDGSGRTIRFFLGKKESKLFTVKAMDGVSIMEPGSIQN